LLQQWLLPAIGFKLEPDTAFTLAAPPQPGWDGTVHCRMLEIQPHTKLSYAWTIGDLDTVVTFTLDPTPSGTRVTLEHTGFKADQKHNFAGARYGWKLMGEKLIDLLANTL
jgi:uncharacterized protein YndB with AHSA1/START domain